MVLQREITVPAPKWLWLAVGEALLTGWVERTASKSRGFDRDKRVRRKSGIPSPWEYAQEYSRKVWI